jgi:hypothetical protein
MTCFLEIFLDQEYLIHEPNNSHKLHFGVVSLDSKVWFVDQFQAYSR